MLQRPTEVAAGGLADAWSVRLNKKWPRSFKWPGKGGKDDGGLLALWLSSWSARSRTGAGDAAVELDR